MKSRVGERCRRIRSHLGSKSKDEQYTEPFCHPCQTTSYCAYGRGAKNIALLPRCSATEARAARVALSGLRQKSDLAREKLSCGLSEAP